MTLDEAVSDFQCVFERENVSNRYSFVYIRRYTTLRIQCYNRIGMAMGTTRHYIERPGAHS
jgi:hypothetical protein